MKKSLILRNETTLFFSGLLLIGVLSGLAGWIARYEPPIMFSVAIGCIPTGALGLSLSLWIFRWTAEHHPERLRIEDDERLIQIRQRAGNTAFWTMYGLVFFFTLLSGTQFVQNVKPTLFGCGMLVLMGVVHAVVSVVYSQTS